MEIKCPCCKAKLTLEHIVLDQVRSDLFGIIFSQPKPLQTAIVSYLALFRVEIEIKHDKALRLVKEIFNLTYSSLDNLTAALEITIDSLRASPTFHPLTNHEYLTKVLVSVEARGGQVQRIQVVPHTPSPPPSKTMAGVVELEQLRGKYRDD